MIERKLRELRQNSTLPNDVTEAVMLLERSGVLPFLRLLARPQVSHGGTDINAMAINGAWSAGANDMLESITDFIARFYVEASKKSDSPSMGFEALKDLKERGDLTEEELDAIRRGTKPNYPSTALKPTFTA